MAVATQCTLWPPPLSTAASGQIYKDDVKGFLSTTDICFMRSLVRKGSQKLIMLCVSVSWRINNTYYKYNYTNNPLLKKVKCKYAVSFRHGQINYKDTKMSSLLVFKRVYRLEIQSVMLVFSTQLCKLLSLCGSSLPPHPKVKVQIIQTVCGWEVVVELCWRPYSAGVNTLYLTRFRTYKIARSPQTKT